MNPKNHLEELFGRALEKRTHAERESFLDEVCRDQPDLRRELESLLQAHEHAGEFFNATVQLPTPGEPELVGRVIGHYRLLKRIGEGGFGVVYLAEQVEPVRRQVALKIIKAGMCSFEVVNRFEVERQALAMMDHENIARVFDAGTTEDARPFFVMELVRGIRITEYCHRHKLWHAERLEFFLSRSARPSHAHQKGIIHRDLKPSNILLTVIDGFAVRR